MSSESAGKHLARLKVQHPRWRLWAGGETGEYWGAPPADYLNQRLVSAADPVGLETKITDADAEARHQS